MPGYIKIHRKITEWEWYPDINTTRLFIHLLLTACFKDTRYKGKVVERGSTITTIPRLSEETGLTIREVRTACEHLMNTGEISKITTNRESVIKVLNYDVYQDVDSDERQSSDSQATVQRQSNDVRTEEECKECKEGKKDILSTSAKPPKLEKVFSDDSPEMKLSLLLAERMKRNNPQCKTPKNIQSWCRIFDKILRIDGRSPKDVQEIIVFSQNHSFWHKNILSPSSLREKYDRLTLERKNGDPNGKNQHNASSLAAGSADRNRPRYGYVAGTNVEMDMPDAEREDAKPDP